MPETVWTLKPHTHAKHLILKGYLGAWLPKLGLWNQRIAFIDGFAGPGIYAGGEPGSPIIALTAAINHKHDLSKCEIRFRFIEADKKRFESLVECVNAIDLPNHIKVTVQNGTFADKFGEVLDSVEARGTVLAPALVMVDPFGWTGMPMDLLARIAKQPRSELLVSFMYESINRWNGHEKHDANFDSLFGTPDWRIAQKLSTPQERLDLQHDLYVGELKKRGMTYVRSFLMLDSGNRPEYFLIFGTKNIEGLKAMKRAMWGVAPEGTFAFSDATNREQMTLLNPNPDFGQLKSLLLERFGSSPMRVQDIENFIVTETAFLDTHYKRAILKPMENGNELEVLSPRQRKGIYPPDAVLKFLI